MNGRFAPISGHTGYQVGNSSAGSRGRRTCTPSPRSETDAQRRALSRNSCAEPNNSTLHTSLAEHWHRGVHRSLLAKFLPRCVPRWMARNLGSVIPSTLDLILITLQRHAIRRPGCRVQHYGPIDEKQHHAVLHSRLALVVSARKKGRLRCRKRPKSREETPKEGSDSGRATAHPI